MKDAQKFWAGLSSRQQLITAIIVIVVLYILVRYARDRKQVFDRVIENKSEQMVLSSMGIKPSYTQQFYTQEAKKIETAIKGAGTDETTVYAVFKRMKNDADLIELEKAFGIREEADLSGWLYGDLEKYEIDLINTQLVLNGATRQY